VLPHAERVLVALDRGWGRPGASSSWGSGAARYFPKTTSPCSQIARNAATALDHAQLIAERR
jgi:hypothetical protein